MGDLARKKYRITPTILNRLIYFDIYRIEIYNIFTAVYLRTGRSKSGIS